MDIQKEFEAWYKDHHHEEIGSFDDGYYANSYQHTLWVGWQAAKASVPEGFVLVEKQQLAQLMADMDYMGKKALGSDYVSFADVATVLDEVIEAQEPSNDS